MNILLLTFQGDIAGSTNSISYLAKGLAEKGHNVYVGCRTESLLFQLLTGTKVVLVPMTFSGRFDLKNIKQIKEAVSRYSIDIINAQSSYDRYSSVFSKWLYKLPVKVVHTRRQAPKSIGGFFQNLVYVKGTDKIIVISDELKKTFESKDIPQDHLYVIYNGVPGDRFKEIDAGKVKNLREKFGMLEGDKVIGCVSRLKNQHQLIEALQYVPDDVKVMFVGLHEGELDEYVNKFGIRNQIIYAGLVDPKEVMSYYPLFNLTVLPSTMDGFGLVLVEAMGAGVPVIGTSSQGIKNVITDGRNGFLFEDENVKELAEKINVVLTDQPLRERLITNGRHTALKTFSIENTVDHYEKFFEGLIAQG